MNTELTIGQVSKKVGLTTKTIRFYESIDLIAATERKENGYRMYSQKDVDVLMLIKRAKVLGLSLQEIKQLVLLCTEQNCQHINTYLSENIPHYLKKVQQQIKELQLLEKKLNILQKDLKTNSEKDCVICSDNAEVINCHTEKGCE